ncbi:MAG: enoyl-CoA hydratase/isomerase family protein, partial [Rhodobacterales bacterium]
QSLLPQINTHFAAVKLTEVGRSLESSNTDFATDTLKKLARNAPLSMACALDMLDRLKRGTPTIHTALDLEYRFTYRAMQKGDFLEGIRAAIIDKDRKPVWKHPFDAVPDADIVQMLAPLQDAQIDFHEETTA